MEEENRSYSVDLIYQISKEAILLQMNQRNSLETKASTLIAFAGVIFALSMGALDNLIQLSGLLQSLLVISVIFFFFSIILCTIVSWIRYYRLHPNIETLARKYTELPEEETKLQITSNLIDDWKSNHKRIEQNALFLRLAFIFQTIAFIILGLTLLLSIVMR